MKILRWLKRDKFKPITLLPGDFITTTFDDGKHGPRELVRHEFDRATTVTEIAVVEGELLGGRRFLGTLLFERER